jgi:uncharacterized protein
MTINYYIKSVYGNELIYLADEKQASLWYMLTNKKTITKFQMENLADLTGVEFVQVIAPGKDR